MSTHEAFFLLIVLFVGCFFGFVEAVPIKVLVSLQSEVEFVQAVGQDRVEVMPVIPAGSFHEYYEPSARLMQFLSSASLYIKNGYLPFEIKQIPVFKKMNKRLKIVDGNALMKWQRYEPVDASDEVMPVDPHVWLSPKTVVDQVTIICDELSRLDPDFKPFYQMNRDVYIQKLKRLDSQIARLLQKTTHKHFLTMHPSFGYFCQAYGLTQISVEEADKALTPQHYKELVDGVRSLRIPVLVVERSSASDMSKKLARSLGVRTIVMDTASTNYVSSMVSFALKLSQALR